MDEILFCFRLADPSGEFEPATELLDALELQCSSIFERENGEVWHTQGHSGKGVGESFYTHISFDELRDELDRLE